MLRADLHWVTSFLQRQQTHQDRREGRRNKNVAIDFIVCTIGRGRVPYLAGSSHFDLANTALGKTKPVC